MAQRTFEAGKLRLSTPVQYLKGVGPEWAELLQRLGVQTVGDLLFYFPRDYQAMESAESLNDLREGQPARWVGVIDEVDLCNTGPGRSLLGILVRRRDDIVRAVWFNQPYMRDRLHHGQRVALEGKPQFKGLRWEFIHPRVVEVGEEGDPSPEVDLMPIYRLTEGLTQSRLRQWIQRAIDSCAGEVAEALPEPLRLEHDLVPIATSIRQIHAPADEQQLQRARERFAFQELLVMQLALAQQRQERLQLAAEPLIADARIDARIRRLFSFALTSDQERAIADVARDMGQSIPMNRLLQGDVGTGKTVIAIYAMLLTVAHGAQAVLMAPTEVLAAQHLSTMQRLLKQAHVRMALLTGQMPAAERHQVLTALRAGELDLLIGTHAVLQEDVQFHKLGLVVIDEQHKFGVKQRARLRSGGVQPHCLIMTATPIPRSIALSAFGDLDTSVLRQLPPGRQPVHTYVAPESWRERWWDFFRRKVREGRQGYVVVPVLDEQEAGSVASLQQVYEALANGELEEFRLGCVSGRMSSHEKDGALRDFRAGKTQVLVATTVVEVGIDVPNATIMTVESGERFGLAQLHQLRGRVARGSFPGYVCVFANPGTEEARQRLEAFASTSDGFELAERDFQLRGPGEILGTRQHGMARFRVADLMRDEPLVAVTQQVARTLVEKEDFLHAPQFARLRQLVQNYYGTSMSLGDVG